MGGASDDREAGDRPTSGNRADSGTDPQGADADGGHPRWDGSDRGSDLPDGHGHGDRDDSDRHHGDHHHGDHHHGDHHHGDHTHGRTSRESSRKLALVAGLNVLGFLAELAGGLLFGSVALLSDAVHMLFDALAYVMAFAAARLAESYDADGWSYGLHRLEPLSAFVNGALLLPMVGYILYESFRRFLNPVAIGTGPTLVVAVGGLVVNAVSVYVLEDGEMSLNERGAYYHLLGDAGGSVTVIVSTLAVEYAGLTVLDPIAAALIAALVLWSAGKLLRGSGAIFLHRTPLDADAARAAIGSVDGVALVGDFHAWQICSEITVATAHVETSVETMAEAEAVLRRVHERLEAFGVDHATVELCPTDVDRTDYLDAHAH